MNYDFHPEAEQEFIETAAYYESEVPGLGARFGAEVHRVIELLLDKPEIGAPVDENIRHMVLRRFPHSIIYTEVSGVLYILAVAHGSREPGYWRSRKHR
jgi:plasmid stabilization system protein ParE